MRERAPAFDKTAIGPFADYCDGYARPGAQGLGYVAVLKLATGTVEKTDDALLDGIVAYDRAEANEAYIGQINMETASSFCGITGQVWGYDLATADAIAHATEPVLFSATQYDGTPLPVYDARPLLDAGKALFGTAARRRFPPAPGAHVICANKSVTAWRPRSGTPAGPDQAYGVWCYIALSIARDRERAADLFIEDAGLWTQNDSAPALERFVEAHRKAVVWSILACGQDQSVAYERTYVGFASTIMPPGCVGTALTVAAYVVLARNAVPAGNFAALNAMTLSEWERAVGG